MPLPWRAEPTNFRQEVDRIALAGAGEPTT
jgi:hypothetical protein